jgi:L-alanine-DL-glutamate epimerase-like enolase superfamily enzyme
VILQSLEASALRIPFNVSFKHAAAERSATQSVWVQARSRSGFTGYGEGCPREYVTAEGLASTLEFIERHRAEWLATLHDVDDVAAWQERHWAEIDANPAAWSAVELAILDLLGKEQSRPIENLIGAPRLAGRFRYSAVIGDAETAQFERQLAQYRKAGFRDFKIKLSGDGEKDRAKVRALAAAGLDGASVRADANNLWPSADAAVRALQALDFEFFAVEEPIRAGDIEGLRRLAAALGARVILDESLARAAQFAAFEEFAGRCILNLRVSKMGGLLRSLAVLDEARSRGLGGVIVGAHVGETSVLTRAALTVANSARDCLVAQEGAFGTHLLAHDVTDVPIMFSAGGLLDLSDGELAARPGLGLRMAGKA